MNKVKLLPTTVFLGKNKKGTKTRAGFMDEHRQVYLPPASAKREQAWKNKMMDRGFEF